MFANSGILWESCTGRIYGPYIRVNFLTPVHTGRKYGCQKCTRKYGPYVQVVRIGLKNRMKCKGAKRLGNGKVVSPSQLTRSLA